MALSGTITGSCDNSHYTLTCEWSATQNTSANTSTITANVYLNGNGYSTISSYWCCTINGTQVTTNWSGTVSGKTKLGSRSWTVSHNSDGTCTTNISFSYSNRVTAGTYTTNNGSGSSNVTLNTIPRASSFSLNRTSGTIGSDQFTISISRASSSFTHTITYKLGSINWVGADKTTSTSFSFTPDIGDCSQLPNSTSGTATIVVDTYSGSTKIGSASKTVTLYVPSSVVPSVGISITANNTLSGHDVAGRTTFTVKPTNASGSRGSTIKSYQITGGGLNSSSSGGATTGTLGAGSYTFTVKVTDSRGRTASASASRTVHAYSNPSLNASFYRCDANGNKVSNGTYCKIWASWNITNVADAGVNLRQYKLAWKKRTSSTWSVWKDWTDIGNYSSSGYTIDFGSGWVATTTYDVKMYLKDSYNEISVGGTLNTQSALLNLEKSGVGIGKIWEQGSLDVGGNVFINGYTKISGNGKAIQLGTGETDVYVHNTASGKYLQLKDDGTLRYDDNRILTNKWVAFDYGTSISSWTSDGTQRRIAVVASHGGIDIGDTGAHIAICSTDAPTWWDGSTSRTLLHNSGHLYMNSGYNIITKNASYFANQDGDTTGSGFVARRYLNNKQQSAKLMVVNSGGGVAGMIHRDETGGYETQVLLQTWASGGSGCFRPGVTGVCENGTSAYKWKFVCANNGTIQTSDERFKVKRGFANIDDCFEMVKNTELYKYIMLDKSKEDISRNKLGKLAMECNDDETKIHMGIMAQDIQKYECGKHILVEGEYEKEDGTTDTMLHINPLDMTMAVMGGLKKEIEIREEEIQSLTNQVENLTKEVTELKAMIQQPLI